MHDITVASGILNIALKEARQRKILRIKIELAEDGHLTKDTLAEAFKLVSQATLAEEALLEIKPVRDFSSSGETEMMQAKILELEVEEN
jgi:Zn finger protein HypA/HybF involved in hydrogenase expression